MKIRDVIDRLGEWSRENMLPEGQVIRLINDLEKQVVNDILCRRETGIAYAEHTGVDEECIIPEEYADMYVNYILAAVYARRYETERAAQHIAQFNNLYTSYGSYVIRTYAAKRCAKITI